MRRQVLVAMTVLTLGSGALAAEGDAPGAPRSAPRRGLKEALGLTDQQSAEVGRLRAEGRKAAIRGRADRAIAREELRELLTAPSLDEKAVAAKVQQLSALQAAALQARTDRLIALRRVLTPEQLERLSQMPPRRPRRHGRPDPPEALTGPEGE
jgi:Spy/CpxP family protein refolding chaperone